MCRFKSFPYRCLPKYNIGLNTSHVSVQARIFAEEFGIQHSLNTSHVSVQVTALYKTAESLAMFKYITCVGSRWLAEKVTGVSVFKYITCVGSSLIYILIYLS